MKHVIHLGDKPIVLIYNEFENEIDVSQITRIDYSNLFGEAVTISSLLNSIAQLRSQAEEVYERKKFERQIMEADLEKRWRKESNKNEGKFTITESDGSIITIKLTEKALESSIIADKGYQTCKNNEISAKRDFAYLEALYWAVQDKSKKLDNMLPKVTPKEFIDELIEGTVNGILIKKNFNK
jgi:hypothetical protein